MKEKLIIIGAGGHGNVIADIALKTDKWKSISYLDDNDSLKSVMGINVIGESRDAFKYIEDYDIFVAVGDNSTRERIQESLEIKGATIPVLIHPSAVIGEHVRFGAGTAVMAGAVINCCTVIGKGCIINTGATIDHNNVIEDYVHISPGVHTAGSVIIGKRVWFGIGSIVINNLSITSGCKIGAGAVVVKNLTEPGTYVGVPARRVCPDEKNTDISE